MAFAVSRRSFVKGAGVALAASAAGVPQPARAGQFTGKIRKAVKFQMIRGRMSVLDKFKMLEDLGYDGVEFRHREKVDRKEVVKARDATGLTVHGIINSTDPDIKGAIDLAKYYGGDSVLLVAGRVNQQNAYDKVYRQTQKLIRTAIPHAEKTGVKLLVENVWNGFLLSPLEMARYIDELDSDHVGAYFDVGNVVRFGWPAHWIRILGKRIGKLDIKEYSRKKQNDEGLWKGFDVKIGDADCDWPEVRKALAEIGFSGWATAEVGGGGRERMQDIAERMNRVLDL